jgi:AraC family transcriptional regulator
LAKIALELERALARRAAAGAAGQQRGRPLARGDGWLAEDVICTCGPHDRSFEERHSWVSIAIVVAGTFQYRVDSASGGAAQLMTPGALLLGNPDQYFECGHEHGVGDRCISFRYSPEHFEQLVADAGFRPAAARFDVPRLPPIRPLAPVVARSYAGLARSIAAPWEEIGVELAVTALRAATGVEPRRPGPPRDALARVTAVVRTIEHGAASDLTLTTLARSTGLSAYHFLRTFARVTGVTPHQYLLRTRMREAALRLAAEPARVVDIALDSGFGDLSNFNRMFRSEFGIAPRGFRRSARRSWSDSARELAPGNGTSMDRDDLLDVEP